MNQTTQHTIPPGYLQDAQGRLVPQDIVKPIDLARDNLTQELIAAAKNMSGLLAEFKLRVFGDVAAFVQLSAEQYGANLGGKKGNVTLMSYDGRYKVQVAKADSITFDERLQAAKSLIDDCINEWSQGSSPEIQVLVQQAFQTDKEGNLNTGRILGLRRLEIKDERWQRAMTAIGESVQIVGSKQYVRFYQRIGETEQYEPISLDFAAV